MRNLLLTTAALALLSGAAVGATTKTVWNAGLDHPANAGGAVTQPGDCLQDNSSAFACWNDPYERREFDFHIPDKSDKPDETED